MKQTCPKCQRKYNDTIEFTFCPHEEFPMHTFVTRGEEEGCAHTPAELKAFVTGESPLPNPNCPFQATQRAARISVAHLIRDEENPRADEPKARQAFRKNVVDLITAAGNYSQGVEEVNWFERWLDMKLRTAVEELQGFGVTTRPATEADACE